MVELHSHFVESPGQTSKAPPDEKGREQGRIRLAYTPRKDLARRPVTVAELLAVEARIRPWVSTQYTEQIETALSVELVRFLAETETLELYMAPEFQLGYFDACIDDVEHFYQGLHLRPADCTTAALPAVQVDVPKRGGGRRKDVSDIELGAAAYLALLKKTERADVLDAYQHQSTFNDDTDVMLQCLRAGSLGDTQLKLRLKPFFELIKAGRKFISD